MIAPRLLACQTQENVAAVCPGCWVSPKAALWWHCCSPRKGVAAFVLPQGAATATRLTEAVRAASRTSRTHPPKLQLEPISHLGSMPVDKRGAFLELLTGHRRDTRKNLEIKPLILLALPRGLEPLFSP
jgi:hypothetical protein